MQNETNFKNKLSVSLAASCSLGLTLFFFGPIHIYLPNSDSFNFMFDKVAFTFLPVALVAILVITALLTLLPQKSSMHGKFSALTIGTSLLLWLQGNMILWNYGVLDGNEIQWAQQHIQGIIDGLIWLSVLVFVMFKAKKIYKHVIKISLFFILVQVLYTGVLFFQHPAAGSAKNFLMLDDSGQFEFSSKRNVIVMVLDGFQSDLFQEIIHKEPGYAAKFDGFTYHRNALAGFPLTQPSIPFMLTGERFDNSRPFSDFIQDAYFSDSSIPWVLKQKGFRVDMLMDCGRCVVKDKKLLSNLIEKDIQLSSSQAGYLFDLTLFKYLPHFFKRFIYNHQSWRFVNYLRHNADPKTEALAGKINPVTGKHFSKKALQHLFDVRFIATMLGQARAITPNDTFKFYHLKGAHAPFNMNQQLGFEKMEINYSNWKKQAKGSLNIAGILLKELKRLNIYDNTMIIIIADHGHSGGLFGIRRLPGSETGSDAKIPANERISRRKIASALPLILVKPFAATGALKITDNPVSLSDIPHTVFSALGINGDFTGRDMFNSEPQAPRTRRFSYFEYEQGKAGGDEGFPQMKHYRITGHSWLPESWRSWKETK